jgi:hypothetical protein
MASTDFLHWDNDIDLDYLLGEYTDYDEVMDSDIEEDVDSIEPAVTCATDVENIPPKPQDQPKMLNSVQYGCPLCEKKYMSISGFRGHVTKKHLRNDLRGKYTLCRLIKR